MANERSEAIGKIEAQINNAQSAITAFKTDLKTINDSLNALNSEAVTFRTNFKTATAQDAKSTQDLKERNVLRKQALDIAKKEETFLNQKIKTESKLQQERIKELQLQKAREKAVDDYTKKELASQKKIERARLEEIRLQKAREKAFDDYEKKLKREQAEKEKANRASERAKKLLLDEANAYKILVKETNKAQAEFLRLAAAHGKNSKQAKAAEVTFKKLDDSLRGINQRARTGYRDVGRYGLAWQKAQSALATVGVSIGIGFAAREGLEVLEAYDEKIADIMKTTQLSREQASFVSEDLLKLDTKTSISNLQELVEAGGRLNITGRKNLVEFATAADQVFVALGDDLGGSADEIATNIGKISAQFGLEQEFGIAEGIQKAGSGINELAAKSKASAPAILDFTNRMVGLSDVLELSDVQALGSLFDESGQSIEVAATTLNKLLPQIATDYERFAGIAEMTPEAFKKIAEQSPVEALKLVAQGAKNSEKGLFSLTSTLESYGVESARAVGIVGTLTNNVDRLTELQGISNEAIKEGTSLTDEFNIKNDTLGATIEKAKKKLQEQVIEFDKATGFSKKLAGAIAFLATNFGTILSVGGKLLLFFGVYKTRMVVLNALNGKFGQSLKSIASAFKSGESNGKKFSGSLKSIGSALKGIGFTAAIAAAWELFKAWANIAFKVGQYEQFLKRQEAARARGGENAQKRVEEREKEFQDEINAIRLTMSERKKAGENAEDLAKEEERRIKELTESRNIAVNKDIDTVKKRKLASLDELEAVRKAREKYLDRLGGEDIARGLAATQKLQGGGLILDTITEFDRQFTNAQAAVTGATAKLEIYRGESDSLTQSIIDQTITINENTGATISGTEAIEKRISLLDKIEDAENDLIDNELKRNKQRLDIELSRSSIELEETVADEQEKARLKELIIAQYIRDINKLEEDAAKERAERDAEMLAGFAAKAPTGGNIPEAEDFGLGIDEDFNRKRLELLKDRSKSNEQVEKESSEFRISLLEREIGIRKHLGLETLDFELELEEIKRKKQDENRKKWLNAGKDAIDNLGKAWAKNYDDRIKNQDELIASEERLRDALQQSAESGTLEQGKSIAAQEEKIQAAQEEKIRLEKEKQAIEFATAAITTFTSALESGKTVPEAFADVALSQAGLELILNQLPKFFHGAEDTGTKGIFRDEFGAVTGVTHEGEAVLNEKMNTKKKSAGLTNESMLDAAIRMVELEKNPSAITTDAYMQMMFMPQIATPVYDDDRLIKEVGALNKKMDENTKAIKNMKFPEIKMGRILNRGFSVIDSDGKGNDLETLIRARRNG